HARSTARHYASLGLRLLAAALLVLALAEPVFWTGSDTLSTVFLIDRSASVSADSQQAALVWIKNAISQKRPTDRAAIVSFGADAAVEQPLSASPAEVMSPAVVDRSRTNIEGALRLAEGILPPSGARRIVLLSDGSENVGSALAETQVLQADGIAVDVVPVAASTGPEVTLRQLSLPPAVHKGERFTLTVSINSNVETAARLRFLVDGKLDSTQSVQLHVGDNSLVYAHDPLSPGEHGLEAIVEADRDTIAENNVGYATFQVAGPPRVLLVEGDSGGAKYLSAALTADGLTVDVSGPSGIGGDVAQLRQFDAIGLLNVAATSLGANTLTALESYVKDFGGGLVAIGGDRSFGVGAYRNTPLEDTLPVTMDVRGRTSHASVVLVLVIDTSGSMSEGPTGATKIELAREAAAGAISQLGNADQVGILAFDDQNHWIIPTEFLNDRTTLQSSIARLEPGGGTAIYPALQAAYDDILQRTGKVKHILLMTDGLAPAGDYEGLTAKMRENGITLSTIAIGTDADPNLLQNLADWGRGRFYDASDPSDVPRFVLKETTEVARAAITEETFAPTLGDQSAILDGIANLPALHGYVAATPKPSAIVGLTSPEGDPILAQWQLGLGRAIAFTSDVSARWSSNWVSWPEFSQFWGRVFKWTVPGPQGENLQVQTTVADGRAHIVVDSIAADGSPVNGATTTASIASPGSGPVPGGQVAPGSGTTGPALSTETLTQEAPGRYAADVPATDQGNYLVQVSQSTADSAPPSVQSHGFTVPYSPEVSSQQANPGLLRDLSAATGGSVLTAPAESFEHNLRLADSARPIWPDLIALLIPIFFLDVAVRRLRFAPTDVWQVVDDRRR
ncbi:MAG TPA: VWA domain-containing protein, partial [Chloroflexota bacterium]|nr:VWA domain-containing protein [Chloroflexota bacterium]